MSSKETHRIIWVSKTLGDAQAALGKLDTHAGIVYKRPSSYGVRVSVSTFEEHWQVLKGEASLPSMVKSQYKYTVDGLPGGISNLQLEQWSETLSWPIRVLRRLNDHKFLVGSEQEKPASDLSLNGQQLLILPHQDQVRPANQVIVGKLVTAETDTDGWAHGTDPWKGATLGGKKRVIEEPHMGPWSTYRPTTVINPPPGLSTNAASSSSQNGRMDALEKEMQVLKDVVAGHHQETKDQFQRVEREICAVSSNLKLSLQEALKEQSQSLVQQFGELLRKSPRTPTAADPEGARVRSRSHGRS